MKVLPIGITILYVENTPQANIRLIDYTLITFDTKNNRYVYRTAERGNRYGVGFMVQDEVTHKYIKPGSWENFDYTFDSYDLWTYWSVSSAVTDVGVCSYLEYCQCNSGKYR